MSNMDQESLKNQDPLNEEEHKDDSQKQQDPQASQDPQDGLNAQEQQNPQGEGHGNYEGEQEGNIDLSEAERMLNEKEAKKGFFSFLSSDSLNGKKKYLVLAMVLVGLIGLYFSVGGSDDDKAEAKPSQKTEEVAQEKVQDMDFSAVAQQVKNKKSDVKEASDKDAKEAQKEPTAVAVKEQVKTSEISTKNGVMESSSTTVSYTTMSQEDRENLKRLNGGDNGIDGEEVKEVRTTTTTTTTTQDIVLPNNDARYAPPPMPQGKKGRYDDYPSFDDMPKSALDRRVQEESRLLKAYLSAFTYEEALYSINLQIIQVVNDFLKIYNEILSQKKQDAEVSKDTSIYRVISDELSNDVKSDIFATYRKQVSSQIERLIKAKIELERMLDIEKDSNEFRFNGDFNHIKEVVEKQNAYLLDRGRMRIRYIVEGLAKEKAVQKNTSGGRKSGNVAGSGQKPQPKNSNGNSSDNQPSQAQNEASEDPNNYTNF